MKRYILKIQKKDGVFYAGKPSRKRWSDRYKKNPHGIRSNINQAQLYSRKSDVEERIKYMSMDNSFLRFFIIEVEFTFTAQEEI